MNLDFLHTKDKENSQMNNFLSSFIQELKSSLSKNQSLVIDRFEENVVVCEKQDNGQMVDVPRELVSENALEGMAIKFENNKYVIDYENCILTRKNVVDELKNSWEKEDGAEYYIVSSVLEKAIKCSNIFMKQNIYIKDENLIKNFKKGDIIKFVDEKYIIDEDKNNEVNQKIKEFTN